MGLREDAEAARLAGIAARELREREKQEAEQQRLLKSREVELQRAELSAATLGIDLAEGSATWVTDEPSQKGYSGVTYLHLRSEDGVWLRYSHYRRINVTSSDEDRWMIVEKCAYCDQWITAGGWRSSLEGIGEQLSIGLEQRRVQHVTGKHPDKPIYGH